MQPPLTGMKVLDLSRILAGPWATMTLGDLGAEVWKIEHPVHGDDTRTWSPPDVAGIATYYLCANRNKKSIAVDISRPEGREVVLELARRADIVVENFRPSSLRKLGLDYETLQQTNPRLVHCSISGYGRNTEFADQPGYDFILQAETGFMSITGPVDGDPMRLGVAFIDLVTGQNAVQAILAALLVRERTGRGQHLDLALHHSGLQFLANVSSGYLNTGRNPRRYGNAHGSVVPYELFDTADGQIALAVGNDAQFQRLCTDVLHQPDMADAPEYRTNKGRAENRTTLIPALQELFRQHPTATMVRDLERAGIPVGQVNTVEQAFSSDKATARDAVVEMEHPTIGTVKGVRSPLVMSETPIGEPVAPPLLGQHTRAVLTEVLGWADERIDEALADGAIGIG